MAFYETFDANIYLNLCQIFRGLGPICTRTEDCRTVKGAQIIDAYSN